MDLTHITPEKKAHINELALKKEAPIDMTPKENAYIYLGHGSDLVKEKITIPEGCILVVKAHSGDTQEAIDVAKNITNLINKENREVLLNPNTNKKKLYSLLTDKDRHSSAIYNPGDKCDNFQFKLMSYFDAGDLILRDSGILKINSKDNISESLYNEEGSVADISLFNKNDGVYILRTIGKKNISEYYKYSNAYDYYYTQQHINDILEALTYLVNTSNSVNQDTFNMKYKKIYKPTIEDTYTPFINSLKEIRDDLENINMSDFFSFLAPFISTSQSIIFEDIKNGLIKPGVFYNLICRQTEIDYKRNWNEELTNVVTMPGHITNIVPEIKNRISEVKQRKNQIREVGLKVNEAQLSKNKNETVRKIRNNINTLNTREEMNNNSFKEYSNQLIIDMLSTNSNSEISNIKEELGQDVRNKALIFNEIKRRINEYEKVLESLKKPKRIPIWQRSAIVKPRVVKKKLIPWRGGASELEIRKKIDELKKVLEIYFLGYSPVSVNEEKKRLTNMITRVKKFNTNTSSQTYKNYVENSSKSNAFTYKKGNNGTWKKYNKNGNPYVDPPSNTKAINTTNNAVNYKMGKNGKWNTIKRNVAPSVGGRTRRNRRK